MLDVKNCFTYTYAAGTHADFTQAITVDAASTNIIDLWGLTALPSGRTTLCPVSAHNGPYLCMRVIVATGDGVSLNTQLVSSTSTTMSGANIIAQYRFLAATCAAGALLINQQIPIGLYQRYLGLYFNVFTTHTLLEVVAWLSDSPEPAEAVPAQVVPGS